MNLDFIEEAQSLLKKPNDERRKIFLRELDAAQAAYIEIANSLSKQSKTFEARARELDVLKKCLGFEIEKGEI